MTLPASRLPIRERTRVLTATWYAKPKPTFIDAPRSGPTCALV